MMHEGVAHAFLVTTADISEASRQWAAGKPITLIDGQALAQIVAALDENRQ
jgi:restriction endonuclease Mrr